MKVYTMGYSGRSPEEIKRIAESLDTVVFDIRYSPRSPDPRFSEKRLREVLGECYRYVHEFGNKNYRGGPIELVDFDAGRELVEQAGQSIILMCVCENPVVCHRTVVAERLRAFDFETEEITGDPSQLRINEKISSPNHRVAGTAR